MRTQLLVLLLLPFFLPAQTGSRPATTQSQSQTADNDQQQETTAEMRADLEEGIMQGYWHSPDLTFFSGTSVTKGWEPTLQRYHERYQSEHKEMGQLDFQDLAIDLLSRRSAVVTGKWELTMSDGKKPHGLFTLIVKRMPTGWKIVHDHTSGE